MKKMKLLACVLGAVLLAGTLEGCSVVESIIGTNSEETSEVSDEKTSKYTSKTADSSIAEPEFNEDITTSVILSQGSTYVIDATAVSTDGGEITYQWYVNNISQNGGGTELEGETEAAYTVDTTEVGYEYYYVVASNEHGDSFNMSTSGVVEVEVIQSGEWMVDEFGGTRYIATDGSYPSNEWVIIGTDTYYFDESGYRLAGWVLLGEIYYYFDEEGRYQESVPYTEGSYIDDDGNLIQDES